MTRTREGVILHTILEDFEKASLRLRERGMSRESADRIGLSLALTTADRPARLPIAEAWAFVDRFFPATQPDGAGSRPQPQQPTPPQPHSQRTGP